MKRPPMKLYGKFFMSCNLTCCCRRIVAGYVQTITTITLRPAEYSDATVLVSLRNPRPNSDEGLPFYRARQPAVLARMDHFFGPDQTVEFRTAHKAQANGFFPESCTVGVRRFRDLCGLVVANFRGERRYQHQRSLHEFTNTWFVCADTIDAIFGERIHGVAEQPD